MNNELVDRLDALVANGVEAAVSYKHRRRLRRLGSDRALHPRLPGAFAAGEPPPRPGCELEVLIDGANALPSIAAAWSDARRFVHVAGWHLDPAFELVHGRTDTAIGVILADLAQRVDVRVLVWPARPFHSSVQPAIRPPARCAT